VDGSRSSQEGVFRTVRISGQKISVLELVRRCAY